MAKKRWNRVNLAALADREVQAQVLGPPVIRVRCEPPHLVFCYPCPFCGQVHRHGARGGPGHRQPHCPSGTPGASGGYVLEVDP